MTASAKPTPKNPLPNVSVLFTETLRLYRTNFGLLFGFAAWLLLPVAISFFGGLILDAQQSMIVDVVTLAIIYPIIAIWISLAIILLIPDLAAQKPPRLTTLNSRARRAAIPFILTVLLVNVIQFAGLVAFILPGIVFSVWFGFATVIVVLEQTSVIESLKRSRDLVKERFWAVFWRLFAGLILIFSFYIVAIGVVSILFTLLSGQDIMTYMESTPSLGEQALFQVFDIIFFPLFLVYTVILYLSLKKQA